MAKVDFEPGRKSIWADESAISADGLLLDTALKAQKKLLESLGNLSDAITAWGAQAYLETAHREAIEAARLIGQLRMQTPSDADNERRMRAGASQ